MQGRSFCPRQLAGLMIAAILTIAFSPSTSSIAFLWHNLIGAAVVVGMAIGDTQRADRIVATPAA